MSRFFFILLIGALLPCAATAETSQAKLAIARLDCGTIQVNDLNVFSDTDAYLGQTMTLVDGCYLLRHGDEYLLWDTGLPAALKGAELSATGPMAATLGKTIVEQLAELGVEITQIKTVAISHYHFDHIGQLPEFAHAKLLIGRGDWEAVTAANPAPNVSAEPFKQWIDGVASNVEVVAGDKDIFGDGRVIMLAMPGHTPGHMSILITSQGERALVLGDAAHSPVQVLEPDWVSRADMDPALTRQTRRALLDRLEREEIIVAAGHFQAPGFGKIVRLQGRRYWRGL